MERAHLEGDGDVEEDGDERRDHRWPGPVPGKERARQNLHQAPADQAGSEREERRSHEARGIRREIAVLEDERDGLLAEDQGESASAHRHEGGQGATRAEVHSNSFLTWPSLVTLCRRNLL